MYIKIENNWKGFDNKSQFSGTGFDKMQKAYLYDKGWK